MEERSSLGSYLKDDTLEEGEAGDLTDLLLACTDGIYRPAAGRFGAAVLKGSGGDGCGGSGGGGGGGAAITASSHSRGEPGVGGARGKSTPLHASAAHSGCKTPWRDEQNWPVARGSGAERAERERRRVERKERKERARAAEADAVVAAAPVALDQSARNRAVLASYRHGNLLQAAAYGDEERLLELLLAGVSPNSETEKQLVKGEGEKAKGEYVPHRLVGYRPLHVAARQGHEACLSALLLHGADVAAADRGRTALHFASSHGHSSCVARLLEAGAAPAARDNNARSNWTADGKFATAHSAWEGAGRAPQHTGFGRAARQVAGRRGGDGAAVEEVFAMWTVLTELYVGELLMELVEFVVEDEEQLREARSPSFSARGASLASFNCYGISVPPALVMVEAMPTLAEPQGVSAQSPQCSICAGGGRCEYPRLPCCAFGAAATALPALKKTTHTTTKKKTDAKRQSQRATSLASHPLEWWTEPGYELRALSALAAAKLRLQQLQQRGAEDTSEEQSREAKQEREAAHHPLAWWEDEAYEAKLRDAAEKDAAEAAGLSVDAYRQQIIDNEETAAAKAAAEKAAEAEKEKAEAAEATAKEEAQAEAVVQRAAGAALEEALETAVKEKALEKAALEAKPVALSKAERKAKAKKYKADAKAARKAAKMAAKMAAKKKKL